MKRLGTQINEDGKTVWRINCGNVERKAMYGQKPIWETVAETCDTPHTPAELMAMCEKHGFGYES